MMGKKLLSGAFAAILVVSTAYSAVNIAQLGDVKGKVLINHGDGFTPASGLSALNVGDKVMVGKDGSATVAYAGAGCSVSLAPATVVTIGEVAPCQAGETMAAVDSVFVTPANYAGFAGAAYVPIVVSASIVVTILTTVWIATNDNDGTPVSAP
jgi:hypothetical protein